MNGRWMSTLIAVSGFVLWWPAAASAADYQKGLAKSCLTDNCTLTFPAVPAGKTLRLTRTSCVLQYNGTQFSDVVMSWSVLGVQPVMGPNGLFDNTPRIPLVFDPGNNIVNFAAVSQDSPLIVQAGKRPEIFFFFRIFATSTDVQCTLQGDLS